MVQCHATIAEVTSRIKARSAETRKDYLGRMTAAKEQGRGRGSVSCGNFAHAIAAAPIADKLLLRQESAVNIGIVTAYNDMLSAHQPLGDYPQLIKTAARDVGATAQIAGGVPAMCDGVTQGQPGMELSLFSRDVIAMATTVSLSHNIFDAAICLGVCDKIVPGLMIGALSFGQLPVIFAPAGPMASGLPNQEKARVRMLFAEGKVDRHALLEAEEKSYHSAGTCTFYGTANSNQMLMEVMGLHLPGAAFINPGTELRSLITGEAGRRAAALGRSGEAPLMNVINEKAIVNGLVGLMATGGSTNHALHMVAIARAAGILINWDDFDDISKVTPLLTRIYPNGLADINVFHAAGGMAFLMRELLNAGLLQNDVVTAAGPGLTAYTHEPFINDGKLIWREGAADSLNEEVLRPADNPFDSEGGLKVLDGNLGRAVIKISAVAPDHRVVEAPAKIFHDQNDFLAAFKNNELDMDFIAVVRFQGPRANGMPELHKLSPALASLQARGRKVALVTDGRMSGASGKTPAAIHLTPEAAAGGPIARLQDGDIICLDSLTGALTVKIDAGAFAVRKAATYANTDTGLGRELFAPMRRAVGTAERGASIFWM